MNLEPWNRPQHYFGKSWDGWLVAPCGQSRDSDSVEASNFRVLVERLEAVDDEDAEAFIRTGGSDADEMCCGHTVVRESHFLVGWVEWIAIPPHATKSIAIALEAQRALEEYPILDEEDHSALDLEMNPPDDDDDEEDADAE
jgi:hypothetical protein